MHNLWKDKGSSSLGTRTCTTSPSKKRSKATNLWKTSHAFPFKNKTVVASWRIIAQTATRHMLTLHKSFYQVLCGHPSEKGNIESKCHEQYIVGLEVKTTTSETTSHHNKRTNSLRCCVTLFTRITVFKRSKISKEINSHSCRKRGY